MTLEEKIDAFVLAQGNQVGAGAELAGILKEIAGAGAPAPLILEGTVTEVEDEENSFGPASGFPSNAEIRAAFNTNRPVFQKVLCKYLEVNQTTVFEPVVLKFDHESDEHLVVLGQGSCSYTYNF